MGNSVVLALNPPVRVTTDCTGGVPSVAGKIVVENGKFKKAPTVEYSTSSIG